MIHYKTLLLGLILCFVSLSVSGQNTVKSKAIQAYKDGQYRQAIEYFNAYNKINEDKESLEIRGICHFNVNDLNKAISDFTQSKSLANKNSGLYWYMAQCHHHLKNWLEACYFYQLYINDSSKNSSFHTRALVELKNCIFNLEQTAQNKSKVFVQELGQNINTPFDEIKPTKSPQFGNLYYFSSNKSGAFEIMASALDADGNWKSEDLSQNVFNSNTNSIIQDIDGAGHSMVFKSKQPESEHAVLAISIIDSSSNESLIELPDQYFNAVEDLQIVNEVTVAFSTDKLPGFGGYDIFTITYQNGSWSAPVNAGPFINSAFNDRFPYFSSDLSQLFYSSDKPYAYGGYDVYHVDLSMNEAIKTHLSEPINSSGNDIQFQIDQDGQVAIFSSDRKSGKGGFDLYEAYHSDLYLWQGRDPLQFQYTLDQNLNLKLQKQESVPDPVVAAPPKTNTYPLWPYNIIYFDSYDLADSLNSSKLIALSNSMQENKLKAHLISYTDANEAGITDYVYYNCLSRAMVLADALTELGVDSSDISIEAPGKNYPLIRTLEFIPDSLLHLNKRIDIMLYQDYPHQQSIDSMVWSSISEEFLDRRFQLYLTIKDGIYYSVHIHSSDNAFISDILKNYSDVCIRKDGLQNLNDYYIGLFTQESDAEQLRKEIFERNNIEGMVQAFYKGKPVDRAAISEIENKY